MSQPFDIGDINFTDPVAALEYNLHIESPYPTHAITNCESCHLKGTYEASDQSMALLGILSASDRVKTWDRNIGSVPSYVAGPASTACGGCHRAKLINEDSAGELVSFLQHTKQGGYLIPTGSNAVATLDNVIKTIFAYFK
jgi:hypothetical protein